MTLLFMDDFGGYGTSEGNMLDGVYAQVENADLDLDPEGNWSMLFSGNDPHFIRKVIGRTVDGGAAAEKFGLMHRFRLASLPAGNERMNVARFLSNGNTAQLSIGMTSTGQYTVYRGTVGGGSLLGTSAQVVTAGTYHHFEVFIRIHDTLGEVEIRHNTIPVLVLTGVDTKDLSDNLIGQVSIGTLATLGNPVWRMKDFAFYDNLGTDNNTFLGDQQVYRLTETADTATADWTKSTGTVGYVLIDEATPDDADYIQAAAAGNNSVFDLTDLPVDVTTIKGIMLVGRQFKSDSGDDFTQMKIRSNGVDGAGADRPITIDPAVWFDIKERNPDGNVLWTPAAVNAAQFKITRTL